MSLVRPYWFAQRQGKAEEVGPNLYKLTGPNLPETYLGIRQGANGRWIGFVGKSAEGPDTAVTPEEAPTPYDAWEAAFELYRNVVII
jgi:hypothetical protein